MREENKVLRAINSGRVVSSGLLMFAMLLLVQSVLFLPYMVLCAFGLASSATYATIGNPIVFIAWIVSILLMIFCLKHVERNVLHFFAALSYACYPFVLSAVVSLELKLVAASALPYEWEKFSLFVAKSYSLPMAALILVILFVGALLSIGRRKRSV